MYVDEVFYHYHYSDHSKHDSIMYGIGLYYSYFVYHHGIILAIWKAGLLEVRCPARRMWVNAREWCNNASEVATSGEECKCMRGGKASGTERSLTFKRRWRMRSSSFRTTRSQSFVLMQTFFLFLFLTDKKRKAVKAIYLLISVQVIFFHALWMVIFLSFYFNQQ